MVCVKYPMSKLFHRVIIYLCYFFLSSFFLTFICSFFLSSVFVHSILNFSNVYVFSNIFILISSEMNYSSILSTLHLFIYLSNRLFPLFPHRLRRKLQRLIAQKWFDYTILIFIFLNCITLAMERPAIEPDSVVSFLLSFIL